MTGVVATYMSSSIYAIDSAWAVLKQEDTLSQDNLPQEGFGAILNSMRREDIQAMLDHYHRLSPNEQHILQVTSQSMNKMPEDKMGQLRASAHNLFQQHEGNFSQLMQDSGEGPADLNKIAPLLVWGAVALTGVFVADDVNRSQGAKASLVGNVVTDIGNAAAWASGNGDEYFGETDYSDVFDYSSNEAGWADPFTGQRHFVDNDPDVWDRIKFGGMTAATSLINPLKPISSMKAGAKLMTRLGTKAATKPLNLAGRLIADSPLARRGDELAHLRRVQDEASQVGSASSLAPEAYVPPWKRNRGAISPAKRPGGNTLEEIAQSRALQEGQFERIKGLGALDAMRAEEYAIHGPMRGRLGTLGEGMQGMQGINPRTVRETLREFGDDAVRSGWKRGVGWGALRGAGHAYGNRNEGFPPWAAPILGLGAGAAFQGMAHQGDFSGGYGGQGAFGTGAGGGAAGGFGQGQQIQGVTNVSGNIGARKQIWDPYAYRHDPRAHSFEQQGEFSGFGKGDNMKIGERMLKEAQDMMYKAVCPKCDKKDCDCKEYQNKADKKPAHGMVIVIGSKAGPGPSKDGKREKVDSEKKEE